MGDGKLRLSFASRVGAPAQNFERLTQVFFRRFRSSDRDVSSWVAFGFAVPMYRTEETTHPGGTVPRLSLRRAKTASPEPTGAKWSISDVSKVNSLRGTSKMSERRIS